MAHHHHVAVGRTGAGPGRGEERLARRGHTGVHLGKGLTPGRAEVRVAPPLLPHLRRDVAQGLALVLAVVDLDPAIVDHHGHRESEERGGLPGPGERAALEHVDRVAQQLPHGDRLRHAPLGEVRIGPSEEEASRVGFRLAVPDQDQHAGSGSLRWGPGFAHTGRR